ncbi:hypothetical protein D3C75_1038580 [compost metagenome]
MLLSACCTRVMPFMLGSAVSSIPENRMMPAVAVQMIMVSINTPNICTSPCEAGWGGHGAAAAAALGEEPIPASLENIPR